MDAQRLHLGIRREYEEWGLRSIDIVGPPRRFWGSLEQQEVLVEEGLDLRRLGPVPLPTELLALPEGDNWQSMSRRSIGRLHAYFLTLEDPQRRLDIREVETLAHQVSLVRHILESEKLKRVLIADEVGLERYRAYPGRPRVESAMEALVVRFAPENSGLGYDRIVGALANLGHQPQSVIMGSVGTRECAEHPRRDYLKGFQKFGFRSDVIRRR